jgi:hypothetical protein
LYGDLFVVLSAPSKGVFSSSWLDPLSGLVFPLLAFSVGLLAVFWAADQAVVRWIVYLQRIADIYARGRFTVRPLQAEAAPPEIRQLAETLDEMAAAIVARDTTLQENLTQKDDLLREIHHRVKNNLQTVAALLRLQARRTTNEECNHALLESVRRVAAIAHVHEALSMSVDEEVNLDEVIDRILPVMNDVARLDTPIRIHREGALGVLDADRATALVMVVTELVQNAIQHGFAQPCDTDEKPGLVVIRAQRSARSLDIVIHDDGRGLPAGFSLDDSDRLGLQIVRTLVSAELDGSLQMRPAAGGGTDVVLGVPIVKPTKN